MGDHETALRGFHDDYEIGHEARDLAADDMQFFYAPGGHWESWRIAWGDNRPKPQYDEINDYIERFLGQWTLNRTGVEFSPEDSSSQDDAEILNGLYRRDFRRNNGQYAQDNAVIEAAISGVGAYRLGTEYADEEKADSDEQIITFNPVHDAYQTVVWDAAAQRADKADASRVTILHEYTRESFEKEWPDRPLPSGVNPGTYNYFRWSNKDSFYVAEQYSLDITRPMAQVWLNPRTREYDVFFSDELKKDDLASELRKAGWRFVRERRVVRRKVEKVFFDGSGFLPAPGEAREGPKVVAGKFLPVIPIYCRRSYLNGQEIYQGLIRDKKDPQRAINLQMARLLETSAGANKRIPILDEEEIDGLEGIWGGDLSQKNYMVKRAIRDKAGNYTNKPTEYLEPPVIDPATGQILEFTRDHVLRRTGGAIESQPDPQLSGKAIIEMGKRIDMNTQRFMDNIDRAVVQSGRVYRAIVQDVYTGSRTVKIVGEDDTERQVQLRSPKPNPETGQMSFENDITTGRYEVIASSGPSYASQREAVVETLKDLLPGIPQESPLYTAILSILLDNVDGPGMKDLKEYNRRQMLMMGVAQPESEEEEAFLQSLQQDQGDPQQDALVQAAVQQALGEAQRSVAGAEKDRTQAALNIVKARQIDAETRQIAPNAAAERAERLRRAEDNALTNRLKLVQRAG